MRTLTYASNVSIRHKLIVVVGAGLSGATIAERYASDGYKVLIIDKRDHIAGNVFDEIDAKSGIRISRYGAHLFHTNDEEVWNYVQRFGEWRRWDLYKKYTELCQKEKHVHFIGRLATYKYFNMDQAICAALDYYNTYLRV